MFLALLMGSLFCCANASMYPSTSQSTHTNLSPSGERMDIYDLKGNRLGQGRQTPPATRFDIYDNHGNRLGYGQRSPINGDIDFFDTRGNRQSPVIRQGKPRGR
jgi:hypothetical protein